MARTLHAVMAYQDAGLAQPAEEAWRNLAQLQQGYCHPGLRMWNFDLLQFPELRTGAANDAAKADMILIATRGAGGLPSEVKAWINAWLPQKCAMKDGQGALGLLLHPSSHQAQFSALAQLVYLQDVARKANIGFLRLNLPSGGTNESLVRLRKNTHPPQTMRLYTGKRGKALREKRSIVSVTSAVLIERK